MKVPQWFVPKCRLLKVAQERVQETLQYVHIDNNIKPSDRELLLSYQESLARFAQKQGYAIGFKKAENSDVTKMNVYKTHLTQHAINRLEHGNWYFVTPDYKASTELPKVDKDFCKKIKDTVKSLGESSSDSVESQRFPQRIRHENKYYYHDNYRL